MVEVGEHSLPVKGLVEDRFSVAGAEEVAIYLLLATHVAQV